MHIYADDVTIYLSRRPGLLEDCVARVNEDLLRIQGWAELNKIRLNPLKSFGMVCSRNEISVRDVPSLNLNGFILPYVEKVKYLGFMINSKMSCCDATSDSIRRIYGGLRNLRISSNLLSPNMKMYLVKSLLLPFFSYNCIVYSCLDSECKRKLNVAFNDCLRYIYGLPRHISVSRYKTTLLGMSLDEFYKFRSILKLHEIIHNKCPEYLNEYLNFLQSPRGIKLTIPHFTHTIGERSYFVNAIRLWNNLPHQLQRTNSSGGFRKELIKHMSE